MTPIPVLDWFDVDQFPFFDHPYALNTAAEGRGDGGGLPVIVWARAGVGAVARQDSAQQRGGRARHCAHTHGHDHVHSTACRCGHPDNGSRGRPNGFYTVGQATPPQLEVATAGDVYAFVAGGTTAGARDASVLVAINNSHLLHRSTATGGALVAVRGLASSLAPDLPHRTSFSGPAALVPHPYGLVLTLAPHLAPHLDSHLDPPPAS
eukprot:1461390-Prymnesium_polylepis.1